MKRRLPMIRKGELALAAIRLPPVTADANRHGPSGSQPGSPAAAANAAPIAATANRSAAPAAAAHHRPAPPPAPRTPRQLPGPRGEPADPAPRRRERHPRRARSRAHPALPACCLRDHQPGVLGRVQPPGQHERRQQRMGYPAAAAPGPPDEDLPAPAPRRTCRQYPDQNTIGAPQPGQSGRGTLTARPAAAYASTVSGHGHTMDMADHRLRSLLATGTKPGEKGSSR